MVLRRFGAGMIHLQGVCHRYDTGVWYSWYRGGWMVCVCQSALATSLHALEPRMSVSLASPSPLSQLFVFCIFAYLVQMQRYKIQIQMQKHKIAAGGYYC